MKTITTIKIHKLIAQTAVYLFLLFIILGFLKDNHLVDQYPYDERMNDMAINTIRLLIFYAVSLFYIISLYAFVVTSIITIKERSTRKQSIIYISIYIITFLVFVYLNLLSVKLRF